MNKNTDIDTQPQTVTIDARQIPPAAARDQVAASFTVAMEKISLDRDRLALKAVTEGLEVRDRDLRRLREELEGAYRRMRKLEEALDDRRTGQSDASARLAVQEVEMARLKEELLVALKQLKKARKKLGRPESMLIEGIGEFLNARKGPGPELAHIQEASDALRAVTGGDRVQALAYIEALTDLVLSWDAPQVQGADQGAEHG